MTIYHPFLTESLMLDSRVIHTLVIENQKCLLDFVTDFVNQINGAEGDIVLYDNEKIVEVFKNIELLDSFINFDINKKSILSKIQSQLTKNALNSSHYESSMNVISQISAFLQEISFDFSCDLVYPSNCIDSLIKSVSPRIRDDDLTLPEKIIDYFELVYEFDRPKVFVTVNLRCYLSNEEMDQFAKTVISHEYKLIMVECQEYARFENEQRHIIDNDLCQIDI